MATTSKPRARKAAPKRAARAAAPKRAAAARAETKPEPRTVAYRGLDLVVPAASEWGSELFFLVGDMQENGESVGLVNRVLIELIGEEQFSRVRAKLQQDKVSFVDTRPALIELFNAVFAEYGTSLGESDASPAS